jgi:hypothetical protein
VVPRLSLPHAGGSASDLPLASLSFMGEPQAQVMPHTPLLRVTSRAPQAAGPPTPSSASSASRMVTIAAATHGPANKALLQRGVPAPVKSTSTSRTRRPRMNRSRASGAAQRMPAEGKHALGRSARSHALPKTEAAGTAGAYGDEDDEDEHGRPGIVLPALASQCSLVARSGATPQDALAMLRFLLRGGHDDVESDDEEDLEVGDTGPSATRAAEERSSLAPAPRRRFRPGVDKPPTSAVAAAAALTSDPSAVAAGLPPARYLRMPPLREKAIPSDSASSAVGGLPPVSLLRRWCARMFLAATDCADPMLRSRLLRLCSKFKPLAADTKDAMARGRTPLHWSCVSGDPHVLKLLLRAGADPGRRDPITKLPPLLLCLLCPRSASRQDLVLAICQDDRRRQAAAEDPWSAKEALASPAFWTDMLLGPGQARPLPPHAPRVDLEAELLAASDEADGCAAAAREAFALVEETAGESAAAVAAVGEAVRRAGRTWPHRVRGAATWRAVCAARRELTGAKAAIQQGQRDRLWGGFRLLHASADIVARETAPVVDNSPLVLLHAMERARRGAAAEACRVRDARGRTPAEAMRDSMRWVRRERPSRSVVASEWGWRVWRVLQELAAGDSLSEESKGALAQAAGLIG